MPHTIGELDTVRVVALHEPSRFFDDPQCMRRGPLVGDIGAVVHALPDHQRFMVECIAPEGITLWIAEFMATELQLESKHPHDD